MVVYCAIHAFTNQPDMAVDVFRRELEYINKRRYEVQAARGGQVFRTAIIQYPRVVAFAFSFRLSLAGEYLAEYYSKRLNAPVFVSIAQEHTYKHISEQAFYLFWGLGNRCIARMEATAEKEINTLWFTGVDALKSRLGWMLKEDSIIFSPYGNQKPMDFILALSKELGLFLGGEDMNSFLAKCWLVKEYDIGGIYMAP